MPARGDLGPKVPGLHPADDAVVEALRDRFLEEAVSQSEFASRLHVSQSMLTRYLRGVQKLPLDVARKLDEGQSGAPFQRLVSAASQSPARSAYEEILSRLQATSQLSFDQHSLSAHNLDRVYQVQALLPDHEQSVDAPMLSPGGSGANTAFGLARLGAAVSVSGIIAQDRDGDLLREHMRGVGLDITSLVAVEPDGQLGSGHTLVFADHMGRRSIFVHPGVNERLGGTVASRPELWAALCEVAYDARIVHLSSFTGTSERLLQQRLVEGLPSARIVSFNPGALYASLGISRLEEFLARTNLLFVYEDQLRQLLDEDGNARSRRVPDAGLTSYIEALFEWRRRHGVTEPLLALIKRSRTTSPVDRGRRDYVTLAIGRSQLEEVHKPNPVLSRERDVDSTGAGDAMAAGVQFALLHSLDAKQCVDLALVMGLEASAAVGARARLPDRPSLTAAWRRHFGTGLELKS